MAQPSSSPNFDFIAPVYDVLAQAVFGKAQQKAQSHFLCHLPADATVLLLGGGTGWLLPELLKQVVPKHVLYLESSGAMLQKARQRLQGHEHLHRVEFRLGTHQALLPQEKFQVILTPFVLDLFTPYQVEEMVCQLDRRLLPGGLWLHTDFRLSGNTLPALWQKPLLWGMYRFFGLVSGISGKELPPMQETFERTGYRCRRQAFFYKGFIHTQVLQKPGSVA